MKTYVFSLLIALASSELRAEDLSVISGNHAEFARLVVLTRTLPDWSTQKVGGGYELRVVDVDASFNTEGVFQKIPKDRITDVQDLGGGRLLLSLGCECTLDVFEISEGLVLDVRDPRFENAALGEPSRVPDGVRATRLDSEDVNHTKKVGSLEFDQTSFKHQVQRRADWTIGNPAFNSESPRSNLIDPLSAYIDHTGVPAQSSATTQDSSHTGNLSRALAEFTLAAPVDYIEVPGISMDEGMSAGRRLDSEMAPITVTSHNNLYRDQFEISSDEISLAAPSDDQTRDLNSSVCGGARYFDVSSWAPKQHEQDHFSLPIRELTDSIGKIDVGELQEIARNLIFFSFAAEASALLALIDDDREGVMEIEVLSSIISGNHSDVPYFNQNQIKCENVISLWALLSLTEVQPTIPMATSSIINNFAALPKQLKTHFASRLVRKLLDARQIESADEVLNILELDLDIRNPIIRLIDADIMVERGLIEDALIVLEILALDGGVHAYSALSSISRILAGSSHDVPHAITELVAATSGEIDRNIVAGRLAYLRLLSFLQDSRYVEFTNMIFDEVLEYGKYNSESEGSIISLIDSFFDDSDDRGLLYFAARIGDEPYSLSLLSKHARTKLAKRLDKLLLVRAAAEVSLRQNNIIMGSSDGLGSIAASLHKAENSGASTIKRPGNHAYEVIERSLTQNFESLGNYSQMAQILEDAGRLDEAESILVRARAWEQIVELNERHNRKFILGSIPVDFSDYPSEGTLSLRDVLNLSEHIDKSVRKFLVEMDI